MGLFRKTSTGFTFGRKAGRKFGSYKPKGGGARVVRTWKPKKKK